MICKQVKLKVELKVKWFVFATQSTTKRFSGEWVSFIVAIYIFDSPITKSFCGNQIKMLLTGLDGSICSDLFHKVSSNVSQS